MKYRNLIVMFGVLSLLLLITLFLKLKHLSQGMNISGIVLGGVIIFGIIVGCAVLTRILRLVNQHIPFWPTFLLSSILAFTAFHIHLYLSSLN